MAGHISVNDENTYREELKNLAPLPPTKEHWRASILQYQGPDPDCTQADPVQEDQPAFASFIWGSWGILECPYFYSGPDPEHQQTFDCMLLCDWVHVMQLSPPPH